jgi:hypothetical protein
MPSLDVQLDFQPTMPWHLQSNNIYTVKVGTGMILTSTYLQQCMGCILRLPLAMLTLQVGLQTAQLGILHDCQGDAF